MKRLAALVVFAVVAVMVQDDSAMAETKRSGGMVTQGVDRTVTGQGANAPSMQQVLLNPRGFDMEWSCAGKSGHSRVFFLRDGDNIVAEIRVVDIENVDINNPINYGAESCTSFAKLTDSGIVFYGCRSTSWDIYLAYDPGNKKTPFKGSGADCPSIALSSH